LTQNSEHPLRNSRFLLTTVTLKLPAFLGMMTGLSYLLFFSYNLKRGSLATESNRFNIFREVARAEWDTLLFFFGVIFCIGGLGYIGYLELVSETTYGALGPSQANII